MPRPLPESYLAQIVAAVENCPEGAKFLDIAASLNPVPPLRNVERWLAALVRQGRIVRVGRTRSARFKPPTAVTTEVPYFASPEGEAIWRLVRQPLAERPPADYRRVVLEWYRPNETYYLPADFRAQYNQVRHDTWRQKPGFDQALAYLVSTILLLEDGFDPAAGTARSWRGGGRVPLPMLDYPEIVKWLAEPERPAARADAQLLWNVRTVFTDLVDRGPAVVNTPGWLSEMYQQVTARLGGGAATLGPQRGPAAHSTALLRTSSLQLSSSGYSPPADPWMIESCFKQVFQMSAAITDPVERSFFLLTHLLYLQPFGMFNATMALLTMNVPLLGAGLPPICYHAVLPDDLLAAVRGIWELNRTELLRDATTHGCWISD